MHKAHSVHSRSLQRAQCLVAFTIVLRALGCLGVDEMHLYSARLWKSESVMLSLERLDLLNI